MQNLIDITDLSTPQIDELIELTAQIIADKESFSERMKGKILATLFYEPSTRTRLSFSSAMMYLGGNVIGFSDSSTSSAAKGESITDTIRIVSSYSDIIAIRTPFEGSAFLSALVTDKPIINAGDGGHAHPTQTLADLSTIKLEAGRLDNLTIGICGDLKYGRTAHSLVAALSRYDNNRFIFISPEELEMPEYTINKYIEGTSCSFSTCRHLAENIPQLDILYMTRIQKERFDNNETYERLKDSYCLRPENLANAKADLKILHPLPRVNEISAEVDSDSRALYFKQALYGRYIRMALIVKLIENNFSDSTEITTNCFNSETYTCNNKKCVTNNEIVINHTFYNSSKENIVRCAYCDAQAAKK